MTPHQRILIRSSVVERQAKIYLSKSLTNDFQIFFILSLSLNGDILRLYNSLPEKVLRTFLFQMYRCG